MLSDFCPIRANRHILTMVFFSLTLKAKSDIRHANTDQQSLQVLGFHDHYAGRDRVEHISSIVHSKPKQLHQLASSQESQKRIMEQLRLDVIKEPVALQANGRY